MTGVFLHSANKTAHIKVVQILREQAGHAESKASSLRKSLANLEKLKTQFQDQAKLGNFQASSPSPAQSVQLVQPDLADAERCFNYQVIIDGIASEPMPIVSLIKSNE